MCDIDQRGPLVRDAGCSVDSRSKYSPFLRPMYRALGDIDIDLRDERNAVGCRPICIADQSAPIIPYDLELIRYGDSVRRWHSRKPHIGVGIRENVHPVVGISDVPAPNGCLPGSVWRSEARAQVESSERFQMKVWARRKICVGLAVVEYVTPDESVEVRVERKSVVRAKTSVPFRRQAEAIALKRN